MDYSCGTQLFSAQSRPEPTAFLEQGDHFDKVREKLPKLTPSVWHFREDQNEHFCILVRAYINSTGSGIQVMREVSMQAQTRWRAKESLYCHHSYTFDREMADK